jgi:hypothetical protein
VRRRARTVSPDSGLEAVLDVDADADQDQHHAEHGGGRRLLPPMEEGVALARRRRVPSLPCVVVTAAVFGRVRRALLRRPLLLHLGLFLIFLDLVCSSGQWCRCGCSTITVDAALNAGGSSGVCRGGRLLLIAGVGRDKLLLATRHGDEDDALLEPGLDALGVAVVGELELEAEAAPEVAGDGALPAHDQAPVAVHQLHPDVLLLVPCCVVASSTTRTHFFQDRVLASLNRFVTARREREMRALVGEVDGEGVRQRLADQAVRRLEVLVRAASGIHGR